MSLLPPRLRHDISRTFSRRDFPCIDFLSPDLRQNSFAKGIYQDISLCFYRSQKCCRIPFAFQTTVRFPSREYPAIRTSNNRRLYYGRVSLPLNTFYKVVRRGYAYRSLAFFLRFLGYCLKAFLRLFLFPSLFFLHRRHLLQLLVYCF
ncbi:unknown [Clostridium sp. CAG:349]|nr:unknown [Clostridium sp. CAG:349]